MPRKIYYIIRLSTKQVIQINHQITIQIKLDFSHLNEHIFHHNFKWSSQPNVQLWLRNGNSILSRCLRYPERYLPFKSRIRIRNLLVRKRTFIQSIRLNKRSSCVVRTYIMPKPRTACFYQVTYSFRVNLHSAIT